MTARRVGVVGGGLAGLTAALRCADEGFAVTLFEARPRLGGLTHSFQRDGLWIVVGHLAVLVDLALLAVFGATVVAVFERIWHWVF